MVWEGLVSDWELDMKKESYVGRGGRGWELLILAPDLVGGEGLGSGCMSEHNFMCIYIYTDTDIERYIGLYWGQSPFHNVPPLTRAAASTQ